MKRKTMVILLLIMLATSSMLTLPSGDEWEMSVESAEIQRTDTRNVSSNISVSVLIDFGNTEFHWAYLNLTDENKSAFNATVKACAELGFELDHSASKYGIFINAIGGVANAADWSESWSLYGWSKGNTRWEISQVGCDQSILSNGDTIAWLYDNWGDVPPVPSPLDREPLLSKNHVLIDFGNGTYRWEDVLLAVDGNVSAFNATVKACGEIGLELDHSASEYGIFINAIGGVANAADWSESWSLYGWSEGNTRWEISQVGCDQSILSNGDTIAWLYDNWGDVPPVPSPLDREPLLSKNHVLIDFGNGTYRWEDVLLAVDGNVSAFNATVKACGEIGLELDHSASEYGIFINAIGGVANAADWSESWSLYGWNATSESWEIASVGCDSLLLSPGDQVAWLYDNWGDVPPAPTPLKPRPALLACDVLIDFGNGTYLWEDVIMEVGSVGLDAFEQASKELGITLDVTEYDFGPFISGVDGIEGKGDWFWSVLVLDNGSWKSSEVGAGDIVLANHSALALYYTVWGFPLPLATPDDMTPNAAGFLPKLTDHSARYTGNLTYLINLTLLSSYNLPRAVAVHIGNSTVNMTRDPNNIHLFSALVTVEGNFSFHFTTSLGAHEDSTAPTVSAPTAVDVWKDRKEAGELEPKDTSPDNGKEVRTGVISGEAAVVHIDNTNGQGRTKITVMGNGTLVVKAMDWEEARGRTGEIGTDLDHLDLFLDITLNELECMDIEIPFDETKLPGGVDAGSLALYFWNTSSGKWEKVDGSCVDGNIVRAKVTHLTIFAPMAIKSVEPGGDEDGTESNVTIIIIIVVMISLVILFVSIVILRRRRKGQNETDPDNVEENDEG